MGSQVSAPYTSQTAAPIAPGYLVESGRRVPTSLSDGLEHHDQFYGYQHLDGNFDGQHQCSPASASMVCYTLPQPVYVPEAAVPPPPAICCPSISTVLCAAILFLFFMALVVGGVVIVADMMERKWKPGIGGSGW
jgi:hypothetical protein